MYIFDTSLSFWNLEERNVLQSMKHHKKKTTETYMKWIIEFEHTFLWVCICVNVRRILVWVRVMSVFPQDIDWFSSHLITCFSDFMQSSRPDCFTSCLVHTPADNHLSIHLTPYAFSGNPGKKQELNLSVNLTVLYWW